MIVAVKEKAKNQAWYWRVAKYFIPPLSELQFIIIITVFITPTITDETWNKFYIEGVTSNPYWFFYIIPFLYMIYLVIKKRTFSVSGKYAVAFLYYPLVGLLAAVASSQPHAGGQDGSMIFILNDYLIKIILLLSMSKFVLLILFLVGKDNTIDYINKNFLAEQYKPAAFLLFIVISAGAVLIASRYYISTAIIAVLAYGYTSMIHSIIHPLIKDRYTYSH